ncbi:hypothetical protein EV215_0094 [Hypnocyclicus thermotrophus]|uniref:DUF4178 domain-containing protein n=1 Tax=Hypnocyclicus thermotrophus TaxID=1627895 RepID=A0AA46E072_9FUSO|nr:hypothetical protein [Hypnocyclicus thermotrophus]TDT72306.1 hypothetical protein EV215_0094 [Hypnocyclicus thermotrophus]
MSNYTETGTGRIQKVSIKPEDVQLSDFIVIDDTWYEITAIYKYIDVEDDDDYWFDFTGVNEIGEKVYIGVDKNEEYIWEYSIWKIIPKSEVKTHEDMKNITYDNHKTTIKYKDIKYKLYDDNNMLYEAHVISWVNGRNKNPISYPVWISDLEDKTGEKFLSIEVDEDNVVEVSIGEYISNVELIKNEKNIKQKDSILKKLKNLFK